MEHDFQSYIRDLVHLLREAAAEARSSSRDEGTGAGFQAGRALAYAKVLSLMQSQADAFAISRELMDLQDFDPASELAAAVDGAANHVPPK